MKFCCRQFVCAIRDGAITIGCGEYDTLAKPDVESAIILTGDFRWYTNFCPFCGKKITFEFEEDDVHGQ